MNLSLLPNDLDELAEGEWTLNWPLSDSNNHALLFERLRALALYKHLGELVVVWDEDTVVIP